MEGIDNQLNNSCNTITKQSLERSVLRDLHSVEQLLNEAGLKVISGEFDTITEIGGCHVTTAVQLLTVCESEREGQSY